MKKELVIGFHAVNELLRSQPERVVSLLLSDRQDQRMTGIVAAAKRAGIEIRAPDRSEIDRLAVDCRHQGVVAEVRPAQILSESFLKDLVLASGPNTFVMVLDEVQDPHNLGACLRIADGAGIQVVIVPKRKSAALSAATRKVASGAAETVPLVQVSNLHRCLRWLTDQGVRLVGLGAESDTSLYETDLTGPLALVLGGEERGLRRLTREQCQVMASLPMHGAIGSLNVSVSAGIAAYEALRQRRG